MCFGFGTEFLGTNSYLIACTLSSSASDSRIDADNFPLGSLVRPTRAHIYSTSRAAMAQGSRKERPRLAGSRLRTDSIRRAAERPRSRASNADCDSSCLLTGVFSAPASPASSYADARHLPAGYRPASPCADPRPLGRRGPEFLLYFNEAVRTRRSTLTIST